MELPLEPMDVYATHRVDLDLAIFCRGHKFNLVSVELARALREREASDLAVKHAERRLAQSEKRLATALSATRNAMDASPTV